MYWEYGGKIDVRDTPKGVDAVQEAIDKIIEEESYAEDCSEYLEALSFSGNYMDCYGLSGDYDDMGDMKGFFYEVRERIIELYPNCSMDAHFCGINSSSGTESVFTTQLRKGHVRALDFEFSDEGVPCPNSECGFEFVSFGNVEFDEEYDCEECGKHISAEEMDEILSEYIEEYDV